MIEVTDVGRLFPALLVAGLVALLAAGFAQPAWCPDCSPLAALTVMGLVYGAGLALSRYDGRTGTVLSTITAAGTSLLIIARVLPPLGTALSEPFAQTLWTMQVRLLTFAAQVGREALAVPAGEDLKRTTLFVWLLAVLLWSASAWLAWWVIRRRHALAAVLPYAALLALNSALAGQDWSLPLPFVACAILLMTYTSLAERERDWDRRGVDYPEMLGEHSLPSIVLLVSGIVVVTWLSMPETRATLRDWLTIRALPPVGTPGTVLATPPVTGTPGNIDSIESLDLGLIGSPPPESLETVMWVTTSDPPPEVDAHGLPVRPAPQHYWRQTIYGTYLGRGWVAVETSAAPPADLEPPASPPPGRYLLEQSFDITARHGAQLFAANVPVSTSVGMALRFTPDGSALVRGDRSAYDVASLATRVTARALSADTTSYPDEVAGAYLQLPSGLPQRVRDLAARIMDGAGTPYDKAIRVQDYLRLSYEYRLDVSPAPTGQDVVDYFLFDAPGGFCSYYASAMAVMLRAEGVPARIVTGFATGEYDRSSNAYRVPAAAAHAWVEVYFPSYGWIEFEPTSARAAFVYSGEPPAVTPTPAPLIPIEWPAVFALLPWAGVALAAAAIGGLLVLYRRGLTAARRRPGGQSGALYWQMRGALARAGLDAPASTTPHEFLAAQGARLASRGRLQVALETLTALYVAAAFRPTPPGAADLSAGRAAWRRAWLDWAVLWLRARLRRAPVRVPIPLQEQPRGSRAR